MIVSLPFGDVRTAYLPDETEYYAMYISFNDLIRLICSSADNPTMVKKRIEKSMGYSIPMKKVVHAKFIHVNQMLDFMDNIHVETRMHTMYVMRSLQSSFKDFL